MALAISIGEYRSHSGDFVYTIKLGGHGIRRKGRCFGPDYDRTLADTAEQNNGSGGDGFFLGQVFERLGQTIPVIQTDHKYASQTSFTYSHLLYPLRDFTCW